MQNENLNNIIENPYFASEFKQNFLRRVWTFRNWDILKNILLNMLIDDLTILDKYQTTLTNTETILCIYKNENNTYNTFNIAEDGEITNTLNNINREKMISIARKAYFGKKKPYLEKSVKANLLEFVFETYYKKPFELKNNDYKDYLKSNYNYFTNTYANSWTLKFALNQKYVEEVDISKIEYYLTNNNINYKKVKARQARSWGHPYVSLIITFDKPKID